MEEHRRFKGFIVIATKMLELKKIKGKARTSMNNLDTKPICA